MQLLPRRRRPCQVELSTRQTSSECARRKASAVGFWTRGERRARCLPVFLLSLPLRHWQGSASSRFARGPSQGCCDELITSDRVSVSLEEMIGKLARRHLLLLVFPAESNGPLQE
jgi:hypothetical protein